MADQPGPLLQMRGISKSFFGVPVLQDVDFDLRRGEVLPHGRERAISFLGADCFAAWRALGLVPSFAGPATYRANGALRAAARATDTLLVETDAPYLAPEGHRGERNEPAYVAVTYAAIAAERGSDRSALAAMTEVAARELFGARWEPTGP